MARFRHAIRATQGRRPYQEDCAAVWPGDGTGLPPQLVQRLPVSDDELIAVLADGMGGHAGGALASSTACTAFVFSMARNEAVGTTEARLADALAVANGAIGEKVTENPRLDGMGTTLVGLLLDGTGLSWTSVGDSPLYVWRRGVIAMVNEDHSMAPVLEQLVADGSLSAIAARTDGRRHMLRSAVTGEALDLVDATMRPLQLEYGDCIVLASDGLDTLAEDEIGAVVTHTIDRGAAAVADALIAAVEAKGLGHQDNATVIVVLADAISA